MRGGTAQPTPPRGTLGRWLLDEGKLRLVSPSSRHSAFSDLFDAAAPLVLPFLALRELLAAAGARRAWRLAARDCNLWRRIVIPQELQPRLTPEALELLIARSAGKLEALEAPNCRLLDDAVLEELSEQPLLTAVSFVGCGQLDADALAAALPPSVRTLRVDGLRVDAACLRRLAASGAVLDVTRCDAPRCEQSCAERFTCMLHNCETTGCRFCMVRMCGYPGQVTCRTCAMVHTIGGVVLCSGECGGYTLARRVDRDFNLFRQCEYAKCSVKHCDVKLGPACGAAGFTTCGCDRRYCESCAPMRTVRCGDCKQSTCRSCLEEPCPSCGMELCGECQDDHYGYCETHDSCLDLLPAVLRRSRCRLGEQCCLGTGCSSEDHKRYAVCGASRGEAAAVDAAAKRRSRQNQSLGGQCIGCNSDPVCGACGVECQVCGVLRCLRCLADDGGTCCGVAAVSHFT